MDRFKDEPYRGVRALFNGDFQAVTGNADRQEWIVVSKCIIEYIGNVAVKNAEIEGQEK
jgi:hypothetical protein